MLAEGRVRPSDFGWYSGLADWTALSEIFPDADGPTEPMRDEETTVHVRSPSTIVHSPSSSLATVWAPPPPEPATAKQKAFLTYMGVSFGPAITHDEAAMLVNETMENPSDPVRLARWSEERLRLHPDIFRAELRLWKEERPSRFHELVESEGRECFHDVSKAHCQVLVGYLDVRFPNWDARGSESTWNYFFPAIAEKFPQLVNKAWRGRLQFPDGPKVARELTHSVPPVPILHASRMLAVRAAALLLLLTTLASAGYYVWEHPQVILFWRKAEPQKTIAAPSPPPAPVEVAPPDPTPPPPIASEPVPIVETAPPTPTPAPIVRATPPPTPEPTPAPVAATPVPNRVAEVRPFPTGGYPFQSGGVQPSPAVAVRLSGQAGDTITVLKPLDVPLKFGRVRINPGTTLKVVGREGNIVTVIYMNSNVAIPVSATDWK
jgi:hypothetical protein